MAASRPTVICFHSHDSFFGEMYSILGSADLRSNISTENLKFMIDKFVYLAPDVVPEETLQVSNLDWSIAFEKLSIAECIQPAQETPKAQPKFSKCLHKFSI